MRSIGYAILEARARKFLQAMKLFSKQLSRYFNDRGFDASGHEATKRHDKVFALLGMSSDDLSNFKLLPDYRVPWEELFQRLTKYLLSEEISVEVRGDEREIAVIEGKGCILGRVFLVQSDIVQDEREGVNVIFKNKEGSIRLTLQASAKPVQDGDLICLLQGASRPTIIRQRQGCFDIIMIASKPPEKIPVRDGYVEWPRFLQSGLLFTRDFVLIWDWEISVENFQTLEGDDRSLEYSTDLTGSLDKATRMWNIALILEDLEEYEEAEMKTREAIRGYEIALGLQHPYTLRSEYGLTPLLWAAENGHVSVVSLLLVKYDVDPDWKDSEVGRTPLSWAAEGGHEAVVKSLLMTGKVKVDSKDEYSRTPLSWAAEGGHEAVVKLLLETGKVEVDSRDSYGRTPLWWAAKGGHETVVKQLLETDSVEEVDLKDNCGHTPLWWAAKGGHEAVVKLLLKTGKVEVNSKDSSDRTPLSWAAEGGYETVVELLLRTSKVEVDSKDNSGRTPLSWAAEGGHEAAVRLLLETGKVEINSKDRRYLRTPLSWATKEGHEAIVNILLEADKVKIDLQDWMGRTPLLWAAKGGHEAIVKLLLEKGKVEINLRDYMGRTPLSWAVEGGHEAIVKLLEPNT
ncbi:hypothetical protein yc1106_01255 [Curvularia clavata]|uniref:Uncharacterized protein n=1 Tax=Curvularia clavata TaxID=95742 RepID=A0A9Q8Z138_CURCL|nr:hypothetical protein yc1106_01255 [Curvularia clavata]